MAPPGASAPSRRAPPLVGRGISATTKSGTSGNKPISPRNAPPPSSKPVARVPVVARVPTATAPEEGNTTQKQPAKTAPPKQPPVAVAEKKSQRPEPPVRQGFVFCTLGVRALALHNMGKLDCSTCEAGLQRVFVTRLQEFVFSFQCLMASHLSNISRVCVQCKLWVSDPEPRKCL